MVYEKSRDVRFRNTRNKNKLDMPLFKPAAGQWPFVPRPVRLWNDRRPESLTVKRTSLNLRQK